MRASRRVGVPNYSAATGASLMPYEVADNGRQACRTLLARLHQELHSLLTTVAKTDRKIRDIKVVLQWLETRAHLNQTASASVKASSLEPTRQSRETGSDLQHQCHKLLMYSNTALTVGEICSKLLRQPRISKSNGDPLFSICNALQALAADGLAVAQEVDGIRKWELTRPSQAPDPREAIRSEQS